MSQIYAKLVRNIFDNKMFIADVMLLEGEIPLAPK
jgi:hypothetical protein